MRSVPHLKELDEKFGARGFEIVAVSNEAEAKIAGFVKKHSIEYGTVRSTAAADSYGVRGIPASFLIDGEGKIVWKGHPSNVNGEMLEKYLKDIAPPTITKELHKDLKKAKEAYNEGEYGKALTEATKAKEAAKEDDEAEEITEDADYVLGVINKRLEIVKAKHAALKASNHLVKYVEALEKSAEAFDGCDFGTECKNTAKEISKSDEYKDVKKAHDDLEKLRPKLEDMRAKSAFKKLTKIAEKYPDTPAGKEAAKLTKDYDE